MKNKLPILILAFGFVIGGYIYFSSTKPAFDFSNSSKKYAFPLANQALAAKFDILSKNGNSSCSVSFRDSISSMPDDARLQGSCCSPMNIHRYSEQVEGLKKFKSVIPPAGGIDKIPDDPYDIEAGLAKELISYYDTELTAEEQGAYDYAMQNSSEKGPCCCKCWRWYVYGGLGKYLIKNHGFTGEQVTEVWNLSDGCGGDSEHY
ncbi:MAG TPA: hypothetical protein VNK70_02840 [Candidatus Paceibacterota bacterium]|nr:hypothetical protein [Candidatus Paceibacterota bacterium]